MGPGGSKKQVAVDEAVMRSPWSSRAARCRAAEQSDVHELDTHAPGVQSERESSERRLSIFRTRPRAAVPGLRVKLTDRSLAGGARIVDRSCSLRILLS